MATRSFPPLLFLAEASNPISLPIVPLPNAPTVSTLLKFKTLNSLIYKTWSYQPILHLSKFIWHHTTAEFYLIKWFIQTHNVRNYPINTTIRTRPGQSIKRKFPSLVFLTIPKITETNLATSLWNLNVLPSKP